jgi:hypothetical protein
LCRIDTWTIQALDRRHHALLTDSDPLGVESFATHHLPLEETPHAYEVFQKEVPGR